MPRTSLTSLLPVLLAAGVCASAGRPAQGQQPPFPQTPGYGAPPPPSVVQPPQQTQVYGRPTAPPAGYAPPAVNVNQYAPPSYGPYTGVPYGPAWGSATGGGLTGAANALNASGEFQKQYQESRLLGQDVERSKIDTRRKKLEQWQWERNNMPTLEDDRRRNQYEQLRRSVNDPPPAEIWDGSALNRLLTAIQQAKSPETPGPAIPLDPGVMSRISFTTGASTSSVGMLKNGPKLRWPLALQDDPFDAYRGNVDQLMKTAYNQVVAGDVDGKVLRELYANLDQMDAVLKDRIEQMTPTQNVQGKRYVRELRQTVKALEQPEAHDYFAAGQRGPARTVGDLVQGMTGKGQKFAPALAGSEPAYTAMHTALVTYYTGLTQPTLRAER